MKRAFLILVLLSLVVIMTSCQKAEEVTITKYFQAMSVGEKGDKDTMTSMAINPKFIKYDSYEIVSLEEPVIEEIALIGLNAKLAEVEKSRKEIGLNARDINDEILDLEDELADARSSRKKSEFRKQIEDSKVRKDEMVAKFKTIIVEKKSLEKKIELEQNMMKASVGRPKMNNIEMYTGKSHTVKSLIKITLPTKEVKDYIFVLKKYSLKLEDKELPRSRYLIVKIATAEEFAQEENSVEEDTMETEEVTEEDTATEEGSE
ncbi:MAG: hypothetical protein ABFR75_05850 [Acidobacteriota bacterium]